jgi:hypothetical protein
MIPSALPKSLVVSVFPVPAGPIVLSRKNEGIMHTSRSATHNQVQGLSQRNVASISQGSNDQTRRVSKEFVIVSEVSITDIDETIVFVDIVPSQAELGLPTKALRVISLFENQLGNNITSVDIEGTDRHNHLSIKTVQVTLE